MPGELNLGTMYASLELRTARLEQSLAQAVTKFDSAGKTIESRAKHTGENVGRAMEDLGRTFSMAVSAPLLGLGVAAVKAATQMDSLKRGLTAVSGSSAETEKQLKRLNEVAKLPGLGLREAIQGSINLQAAGFSAKQAERSLMAFGNALATVGKGKAELDRVNLALTQLANKTTGFGQDIRQLQEALPQVRQAMLRAFGTADTEIIAKAGITGKQFVDVLTKEFERLPKVTGGIQNSFENLQDQLWKTLGELGKTLLPAVGRATDDLTAKLQAAANWWKHLSSTMQDTILKGSVGLIGAGGLLFALGKVVSMVTVAIEAFRTLRNAIIGASVAGAALPGATGAGTAAGVARIGLGGLAIRALPPLAFGAAVGYSVATLPGMADEGPRNGGPDVVYPPGYKGPRLEEIEARRRGFRPFGAGINPQIPPPEDPQAARYRRMIAALTASENAKKVGAAARKAQAAENARQRLDLAVQEAMGFGWYDPEQVLAQYQTWQKTGAAEQMGKGLAAFAQSFVAAVSNVVVATMTGRAGALMGGAVSGMGGAFGGAMGTARNLQGAAFLSSMRTGLMGSMQGAFGGMMGVPATATAAAQSQVLGWMQNAFGQGGGMWDSAKIKSSVKRGFDFVPDLAMNLANEFTDSFGRGLERAFGKNPFGRAIAHSLTNMMQSILDNVFMSGVDTGGGEGGGGKDINWGAMLGKLGLGAALSGLGSLFGGLFQEGGVVPGPAGRAKLAVVHGGEVVLNQRQQAAVAGGGITVNMGGVTIANRMDAAQVGREIAWQIRRELRAEV